MFVEALILALRDGLTLSDELHSITERLNAAEGQERRAARTFALCGLAGELASRWKVVPWADGEATDAAAHAFDIWRKRRGAAGGSSEHAAILRAVSDFIDRHADSRFSNIDGSAEITRDRAGYWKQDGSRRLYLFTSVGLREATKSFELLRVTAALHKAGALAATDLDKRSKRTRDPTGRSVPLYHVDPEALDSD
ncbi:conserved hypothetical protein [Ricinus communis]|uniref:Uncharacterized protein n=1 Tax=Ricinus communis TaxID=3988 RepID=B9TJP1_RICCO|nr:conserved hypothetical protein [Ricinus communis]